MSTNILFLTHQVPYPPNRGDRIRSYNLLRFLAKRAEVHLATLSDEPIEHATRDALDALCARVAYGETNRYLRWGHGALSLLRGKSATEGLFQQSGLRRRLHAWAEETHFDAVVVFCSSMAQFVPDRLWQAPVVVDLVDVDSEKWHQYADDRRGPKRWLYRLEAQRVRQLEEQLAARAAALTVVSREEASLFRSFCNQGQLEAVGNGVDTDYFHPQEGTTQQQEAEEAPNCVFIGVLDYYPNVEGMRWFCREVWPAVRNKIPGCTLSIVGRNPSPSVIELQELDGVTVVGEVPDVRPYLQRATVSIAPLQIARGVQNKVLEAMSAGKPVVATAGALTGLSLEHGRDAVLAEGPEQWRIKLIELLSDSSLQRELAVNGRAYVERCHGWSSRLAPFAQLLGLTESNDTVAVG